MDSDKFLNTPESDVARWLERNGCKREDVQLKSDVVLAVPPVFNALTNYARSWECRVESVPVVWEPGALNDVLRAVNIRYQDGVFSAYRIMTSAPMAAAQLDRLIAVGGRRFLILETADPISEEVVPGDLILASSAVADDGVSRFYTNKDGNIPADSTLLATVSSAAAELDIPHPIAPVWSSETVYRRSLSRIDDLRKQGVLTVETEVSALYAVAAARNVSACAVLAVDGESQTAVDAGIESLCTLAMRVMLVKL